MPRKLFIIAPAALVTAVLAAGCGGGSGSSSSSSGGGGSSTSSSSGAATVAVRSTPLGQILVAGNGETLYLFKKDTGSTSTCNGACAKGWPPFLTTGSPKASTGASSSMIGTTMRADGKTQVTYAGHPLYFFVADSAPGETKGQAINAFGALWYVLSPAGNQITAKTGGGSTTSTGSSGGYGY
ncbi:MAG: hypothetical protein E6G67_02690 [Actinobacteria bacterium]|nr:MAG: hypothetical protein E6G67_02690 [Actinomycetota bacterium]